MPRKREQPGLFDEAAPVIEDDPPPGAPHAARADARFVAISAVSAGVADLRRVVAEAREALKSARPEAHGSTADTDPPAPPSRPGYSNRTILFIDEIHRFNKAQQDAVLPYVEDGTITLIGATTVATSSSRTNALGCSPHARGSQIASPPSVCVRMPRTLW